MRIGIVTIFNVPNYGALLQAYSLYRHFESLGHTPIIFEIPFLLNDEKLLYRLKHKYVPWFKHAFVRKYLPKNTRNLKEVVDLYVVGSDQVWNPEIVGTRLFAYMLDFAPSNLPRISYASSFGTAVWTNGELTNKAQELLQKFSAITVRESSGVKILEQVFGITGDEVLDPCFLLPMEDSIMPITHTSTNSIVSYKLFPTENWDSQLDELATKLQCERRDINFSLRFKKLGYFMGLNHKCLSVSEWLSSIANAKYVITDSFHGTVWALRFQKQFLVLEGNKSRMTRMISLLEKVNLKGRIVKNLSEGYRVLTEAPIDYSIVTPILDKEIARSKNILQEMIHGVQG